MIRIILLFALFNCIALTGFSQTGSILGTVSTHGLPLEFASIGILHTNWGATTDTKGNFILNDIPYGQYELVVSIVGFENKKEWINLTEETSEIILDISLIETTSLLDEVVISGTRTERYRSDLPIAVQVLTSEAFEGTQASCLAEGLNFQPGLRMETDCQTCNYTQLRMNGLGGGYSQILINSRPIFSALNGLYGLEQIPANMIDRVEVVRGGGSAMFGSSAIAGTVNVITKNPTKNSYAVGVSHSLIDGTANDNLLNANLTQVNKNETAGLTLFASRRQRQDWDANGDGFSEIPRILNNSFGLNTFWQPSKKWRLGLSLNSINEERDGGDLLDEVPHQRTQSENRLSYTLTGNADLNYQIDESQNVVLYGGVQTTDRRHYTGIDGEDGYGNTDNYTIQGGAQYNRTFSDFFGGMNTFTLGTEYQLDDIFDEIPAYNYLIDQRAIQSGTFLQSDWVVNEKITVLAGVRLTHHNLAERAVLTPRFSVMYSILPLMKARFSYGRGFRAPQAFDADLHIAFAGGGISTIQLADDLQSEFSDSYSVSWDFDKAADRYIFGFTVSGFYTDLQNVFILEEKGEDVDGNLILEKRNGNSSQVRGITFEGRANFDGMVEIDAGITFQKSEFEDAVSWSSEVPSTTNYLRTPDNYGFYTINILPENKFSGSLSGVYTGSMLVPHFGGAPEQVEDELVVSRSFLETNLRLTYEFDLSKTAQTIELAAGVQNIFNAYQRDFDTGKNRDSNYVYGPARPRTFYVGVKYGSF